MPELSEENRAKAVTILERLRADILAAAAEDRDLVFQMKRYISKRLEFDERGTPTHRKKLKELMWKKQSGLCALCKLALPERGAELDRFKAIDGYTAENTQLLCRTCHVTAQEQRGIA